MTNNDNVHDKPIDDINAVIGLMSLLVNVEIWNIVQEHLGVLKETRSLKNQELELKHVQARNDLRFYESVTSKLDDILKRLS